MVFSVSGLINELLEDTLDGAPGIHPPSDDYVVQLPVRLQRCGRETRLVVPNQQGSVANHATIKALQSALAKAIEWNQALISGEVSSMAELARTNQVTQRYIAHLIKLAFLSPEIMKAITDSRVPPHLTLDRLKKGFPLDWTEQRKLLEV